MKYPDVRALSKVAEFHRAFDLPILEKPQIPNMKRCELRINLIDEELQELKEAIADGDLTEAADAFADLQYVLSGAILEFGLADRFLEIFDEVQRSNMSKRCRSREEAERTLKYYQEQNVEGMIVKKGDGYLVYRKVDGKVLKSVDYSPADIAAIVEDTVTRSPETAALSDL